MNRKDFHEQGNATSLLELRIKGTSENDKKGNFPFSNANKSIPHWMQTWMKMSLPKKIPSMNL